MRLASFLGCSLLAGALALAGASPALAQSQTFLELNPAVQGEATTSPFEQMIEVSSISWGASNPACSGSKGNIVPSEFIFTKGIDRASTTLYNALRDRLVYSSAKFRVARNVGGGLTTFTTYDFQDAILSSVSSAGTNGDSRPVESWSLSFSAVVITYVYYDSAGKNASTTSTTITPSVCPGS